MMNKISLGFSITSFVLIIFLIFNQGISVTSDSTPSDSAPTKQDYDILYKNIYDNFLTFNTRLDTLEAVVPDTRLKTLEKDRDITELEAYLEGNYVTYQYLDMQFGLHCGTPMRNYKVVPQHNWRMPCRHK